MNVRAKFRCQLINHLATGSANDVAAHITLFPVYEDGSGENASWSKYTPNGKMEMTVTNPAAIAAFEMGKAYYLDFTPAE